MKNEWRQKISLTGILFIFLVLPLFSETVSGKFIDVEAKNRWVQKHFLDSNPVLPFSFIYNGKNSASYLSVWQKKNETVKINANQNQYKLTWTNAETGFEIQCIAIDYFDYPVIEWVVYLKNNGVHNTQIIKDILGLDAVFLSEKGNDFILNGIKGDFCTADSYEPYRINITSGYCKSLSPSASGKSSDGPNGWPYYNLQSGKKGTIIAIGWPGQWSCSFACSKSGELEIKAGQQLTNLYLKPGEVVRTPSITMLFWKGEDMVSGQNTWRRFYVDHIMPHFDGKPQQPVMQIQVGAGLEDTVNVKAFLEAGIKPDVCWRDAGGRNTWYPSESGPYKGDDVWLNTGTWNIDPKRYPNGFRPFSDWIHQRDIQFVLWFEPERVGDPGSWLSRNHPDWLLPGTSHGALLNEGNQEALNWLINHVDSLIKSQRIDWYREDMNGAGPLPAWHKHDSANRQGATENFYVQGHLAFWDELKRRNPNLHIDACASGGRRNDLETMKRAVPLLRSDFQWSSMENVVIGNQGHTYGLSFWLPFQGTGAYIYDIYSARSFYIPGYGMGGLTPENTAVQLQAYTECRRIAPSMLFGDYYPLTPYSRQDNSWIAWQFNNPQQHNGVVQAFRRIDCVESEMCLLLKDLNPKVLYEVVNFDTEESLKISGNELMKSGLKIKIHEKPGAAIISYKQL